MRRLKQTPRSRDGDRGEQHTYHHDHHRAVEEVGIDDEQEAGDEPGCVVVAAAEGQVDAADRTEEKAEEERHVSRCSSIVVVNVRPSRSGYSCRSVTVTAS